VDPPVSTEGDNNTNNNHQELISKYSKMKRNNIDSRIKFKLPKVSSLHNMPTSEISSLQKQTAKTIGKSVVFQDVIFNTTEQVNGFGPRMVVIPAGSFIMGCSAKETSCPKASSPNVVMTHDLPFAVSETEVTFTDWQLCVAAKGCQGNQFPDDAGWGRGLRPVMNVSWYDALEYTNWLSGVTGKQYRLLSESEWEYVARAGTSMIYSFGNNISCQQASFNGGIVDNKKSECFYLVGSSLKGTSEVKSYPPNAFGLFDMQGNVWEWTLDCWSSSLMPKPLNGEPYFHKKCNTVVTRGGSWNNESEYLRLSSRLGIGKLNPILNQGFRIAQDMFVTM